MHVHMFTVMINHTTYICEEDRKAADGAHHVPEHAKESENYQKLHIHMWHVAQSMGQATTTAETYKRAFIHSFTHTYT